MSGGLEFTGERFIPGVPGEIWYEHWHRYHFAAPIVAGRNVLDIACGAGYGSALLARSAARVTGADISPAALDHARAKRLRVQTQTGQGAFVRRRCRRARRHDAIERERKARYATVHQAVPSAARQSPRRPWSVRSTCNGVIETKPCAAAWKSVPAPASRASPAGPIQ